MKAKHLLPLLTVFTLVGCNKNLKTITDDQAKEVVKGILERQGDSTRFDEPKTLTYKASSKTVEKGKGFEGEYSTTSELSDIIAIDVNNLKSSSKSVDKDNDGNSQIETIEFYDSTTSKLTTLLNVNGYKTKYSVDKTAAAAKSYFEDQIKDEDLIDYKNKSYLSNFETTLEEYKTLHKKYETESDQYFKYSFGSSDAKSFQVITDQKTKYKQTVETVEYSGYQTSQRNAIMKNDRMLNYSVKSKSDIKGDKASFYDYSERTINVEYSYDSVTINVPDISEYETIR